MDIYSLVHYPCTWEDRYNDGGVSCDQCYMWQNNDSNLTNLTKLYSILPLQDHVSHQDDYRFDFFRFIFMVQLDFPRIFENGRNQNPELCFEPIIEIFIFSLQFACLESTW